MQKYQHLTTREQYENDMGSKGQPPSAEAFDAKRCGGQDTEVSGCSPGPVSL